MWAAGRLTVRAAVSAEARDTIAKVFGGEYELVWNGIDFDLFRDAKPWPSEGPTVMFIGRHEPRKGLAVLIEAMGMLGPDVHLWMGSQGPETDRLQNQTAEDGRIEWLGLMSDTEKIRRIKGADVLRPVPPRGELRSGAAGGDGGGDTSGGVGSGRLPQRGPARPGRAARPTR